MDPESSSDSEVDFLGVQINMSSWQQIIDFHIPKPTSLDPIPGGTSTAGYSGAVLPTMTVPDVAIFDREDSILQRATEALRRGLDALPRNPNFPTTLISSSLTYYARNVKRLRSEAVCSQVAGNLFNAVCTLVPELYRAHGISANVESAQPPLDSSEKGDFDVLVTPNRSKFETLANAVSFELKKPNVLHHHLHDMQDTVPLRGRECSGIEAILFKVSQPLRQSTRTQFLIFVVPAFHSNAQCCSPLRRGARDPIFFDRRVV